MKIYLTVGRGDGPTPLAAFDNAMYDAHVGNYNLMHLSSVIPPYSTIEHAPFVGEPKDYGDRLYVVMASKTETEPGKWAWAGLSWTQEPTTMRGLFVEQHGSSEAEVRRNLESHDQVAHVPPPLRIRRDQHGSGRRGMQRRAGVRDGRGRV